MAKIDQGLLASTRSESKKNAIELSKGVRKTGKEKVQETFSKNTQKNANRRNAMIQKFLNEGGKGTVTDVQA